MTDFFSQVLFALLRLYTLHNLPMQVLDLILIGALLSHPCRRIQRMGKDGNQGWLEMCIIITRQNIDKWSDLMCRLYSGFL